MDLSSTSQALGPFRRLELEPSTQWVQTVPSGLMEGPCDSIYLFFTSRRKIEMSPLLMPSLLSCLQVSLLLRVLCSMHMEKSQRPYELEVGLGPFPLYSGLTPQVSSRWGSCRTPPLQAAAPLRAMGEQLP